MSNKEEQQLDICLRSMMSYVGRNRMQTAIENLAFHDNNGYPNFAYFFCHLEKMNKTGGFNGFTAIMYNLKDFSVINRDLGFEEGNAVMKAHFDTLRDMIGNSGTVCRVGGDNFAAMDFIPILERNTDIFRLDFYMLDLVCKNIRKWLDEGKNVVRISINFSRKHLTDPELLDKIVSIINRYDIPYEYIEIELTETTTEGDYLKLKKLVEGLTKIGIHTSIDDFGIGYSSINLIRELPWNVMKIDRSLLREELDRARQRKIEADQRVKNCEIRLRNAENNQFISDIRKLELSPEEVSGIVKDLLDRDSL